MIWGGEIMHKAENTVFKDVHMKTGQDFKIGCNEGSWNWKFDHFYEFRVNSLHHSQPREIPVGCVKSFYFFNISTTTLWMSIKSVAYCLKSVRVPPAGLKYKLHLIIDYVSQSLILTRSSTSSKLFPPSQFYIFMSLLLPDFPPKPSFLCSCAH